MQQKKILLFTDWFEPGFKAGGPIRSCVNFARNMKSDYRVFIFTGDRDLHDAKPYAGIPVNKWILFEQGIEIFYCPPDMQTRKNIMRQWTAVQPDFIYLNSMFSYRFTILPLLLSRKHPTVKVILAPRGMLKPSALQFKRSKKKIFLSFFSLTGMQRHIRFHATDAVEMQEITRLFGNNVSVTLAGNFPGYIPAFHTPPVKQPGELKIIFIGRIHPIKNLDFLLKRLPTLSGNITLTVVGGEEDKTYAATCREIVQSFPDRIKVTFAGETTNRNVPAFLAANHIFALPTSGENFGHAIFEALAHGQPVLVSDQTPWRNLQQRKAGWDLPLHQPVLFEDAIRQAVSFDDIELNQWSSGAWEYVRDYVEQNNLKEAYQRLFN